MRFRDPVCGMEVRWEEAVDYEVVGPVVVYFCCWGCATRFREDPAKHVDVQAWLGGAPAPAAEDCGGAPLELESRGDAARTARALATQPRIGDVALDELEAVIARRWRRLLDDSEGRLRSRTLERGLLTYALARDPDQRHDIDRLLAAEVARLRTRDVDSDRVKEELAALPRAFASVLLDTATGPAEMAAVFEAVDEKLTEVRPWVFASHDEMSRSADVRIRAS